MALGDALNTLTEILDNEYLDIQPSAGVEWIIHNITVPNTSSVELYMSDSVNEILVDSNVGGWIDFHFHSTNSVFYRIKNTSGVSIFIGYDGIVSKEL